MRPQRTAAPRPPRLMSPWRCPRQPPRCRRRLILTAASLSRTIRTRRTPFCAPWPRARRPRRPVIQPSASLRRGAPSHSHGRRRGCARRCKARGVRLADRGEWCGPTQTRTSTATRVLTRRWSIPEAASRSRDRSWQTDKTHGHARTHVRPTKTQTARVPNRDF